MILNKFRNYNPFAKDKKLTENFVLLYGTHIARYVFPLIIVPFLARVLGADSWGKVLFVQSYAIYIALLLEFGFGISGTKDAARFREVKKEISKLFSSVIIIQVIIGLFLIMISLLILPLVNIFKEDKILFFWGLSMGIFQGLNPLWFFRGLEKMRVVAILIIVSKLIATVSIFIFVRSHVDDWIVLASFSVANLIALILAFMFLKGIIDLDIPKIRTIYSTFKKSLVLFWVRAGGSMFNEGNIFVVGLFLSSEKVAFFGSALKIISSLRSLLNPAVDVLFPRISYLVANDVVNGVKVIKRVFIVMSCLGLIISLGTYFGADIIVKVLLGSGYSSTVILLKYLSPLSFVTAISLVFGTQWMVALNLDMVYSIVAVIGGCINILITYFLLLFNFHYNFVAINILIINIVIVIAFYLVLHFKQLSPFQKIDLNKINI